MVEIVKNGCVVSRSKNMRGIIDYVRKHSSMEEVRVLPATEGGAFLEFLFRNGARCIVYFNSRDVAIGWIISRRSWGYPMLPVETVEDIGTVEPYRYITYRY